MPSSFSAARRVSAISLSNSASIWLRTMLSRLRLAAIVARADAMAFNETSAVCLGAPVQISTEVERFPFLAWAEDRCVSAGQVLSSVMVLLTSRLPLSSVLTIRMVWIRPSDEVDCSTFGTRRMALAMAAS